MKNETTHTVLSLFCDKLIEAGWLTAIALSALFMNIYTHRMFEPDKSCLLRTIALLMVVAWLIKNIELKRISPTTRLTESSEASTRMIYLPVLLLTLSYIISLVFSTVPFYVSFWGSYDRLQGVYTTFSYFIIFLLAATHLKEKEQVDRLIHTMILTSVPIIIYAFIQRLKLDPVPWKGTDPSERVSATMGNPIFFSAYLIMVVPLTLAQLISSLKKTINRTNFDEPLTLFLKVSFYGMLLAIQLVSIALAKSRGPIAGCLAGLGSFFIIWAISIYLGRRKVIPLISCLLIVILTVVFIVVLNIPNGPLKPLTKNRYLERLSQFHNFKEGSGRVRMILWTGSLNLIKNATPLQFIFGYGPESIGTIFYRQHSMELTGLEGSNVHADRAHNTFLDHWVMRGVFGLFSYLFLLGTFLYLGLKTLWKNPEAGKYHFLLTGLIAAGIAHIMETGVGIDIVVTQTYFWLSFAALWGISKISRPAPTAGLPASSKKKGANINEPIPPQNKNFGQAFARQVFWTYVGVTFAVCYAVMKWHWPDVTYPMTKLDWYIIITYLWFLAALPLGALAIIRYNARIHRESNILPFSNFLVYLVFFGAAAFIFIYTNLNPIRADGAYKFCFSYDTEATDLYKQLPTMPPEQARYEKQKLFSMRIESIPYYQQAIRLSPGEKSYLNGAGRNFMELVRLIPLYLPPSFKNSPYLDMSEVGSEINKIFSLNVPDDLKQKLSPSEILAWLAQRELLVEFPDKLSETPDLNELLEWQQKSYRYYAGKNIFSVYHNDRFFLRFSPRDFIRCCFVCIEAAYQLEPDNFERIIALANVYNQWGLIESEAAHYKEAQGKYEEAVKLYEKARLVSPYNEQIPEMIKSVKNRIQWIESKSGS